MNVKQQQGGGRQGDLLDQASQAARRHGVSSNGGTGASASEERQAGTAGDQDRAVTQYRMEEVASAANLNRAYQRVKANGGAPGVDGMTVEALRDWLTPNRETLVVTLLDGSYRPHPVRGVSIPKPDGGNANSAFPRWWTGWCSKRSRKCWSRSSIRASLGRGMASGPDAARTMRCAKHGSMGPTAMRLWWISTWKSSSTGSTTTG
jgi:hypothetical protein